MIAISLPAANIVETTKAFIVETPDPVVSYLLRNAHVTPHLNALLPQAAAIYGDATKLTLRWDRDPDADAEYLVVGVRTSLAPNEAHPLLYRLREAWWASAPLDIDNNVLIANEYV